MKKKTQKLKNSKTAGTRGNLNCNLFSSFFIAAGSAHCLRHDPLWYEGYEMGTSLVDFEITVNATTTATTTTSSSSAPPDAGFARRGPPGRWRRGPPPGRPLLLRGASGPRGLRPPDPAPARRDVPDPDPDAKHVGVARRRQVARVARRPRLRQGRHFLLRLSVPARRLLVRGGILPQQPDQGPEGLGRRQGRAGDEAPVSGGKMGRRAAGRDAGV